MLFSRKGKLKKEFNHKLVLLLKETKDDFHNAKVIEGLSDDYNIEVTVQRKIAESIYFYLFKEARVRKVVMK